MTTVFIFHGYGADPCANWFPWLKEQLEAKGYTVFVPAFPNTNNPDREKWLKHFEQYKDKIDVNTIFVGHSLGAPFILNILESFISNPYLNPILEPGTKELVSIMRLKRV